MRRACESCGKQFEAKTQRARYCGSTCRGRARRTEGRAEVVEFRARDARDEADPGSPAMGAVERATHAELAEAERLDTSAGAIAITLARRLDRAADTGSAMATLGRELRATLDDALKGTGEADRLDELREQREKRRQRASNG